MTREPKKRRPVSIPINGNAAHNSGVLISIGSLVVNWANNESVFLAMLQALVAGGAQTAAVIWQSQSTSRPRLNLVARLVREQVTDADLILEIEGAIRQFEGFSRARNFYCHATYTYDTSNNNALVSATAMTFSDEGVPLRHETKYFDRATINEISATTQRLAGFNRHLWGLVGRLEASLGVQRVRMPLLPPLDSPPQSDRPPSEKAPAPESPPEPSQQ